MTTLVLGAGVSGAAAARLLRRHDEDVRLFDEDSHAATSMQEAGYEVRAGAWDIGHLDGVDRVITSPGFAAEAPPIVDALKLGVAVWSEIELAWHHTERPVVAITGTNGKTTTTQLVVDMAEAGGVDAVAAGNIGVPFSDVVATDHSLIVAETSSFQLAFIEGFAPIAAAVLNVAPDHLDWHGSFEAYAAAKARITQNMEPAQPLVFDADDAGAAAIAAAASTRPCPVSGSRRAEAGGFENGSLWVGDDQFALGEVDPAWRVDIAVAAVIAAEVGVTGDGIAAAIERFEPAPHRRALVATDDGIAWVDDSKATNPHAAVASASAYPSVILIAGGRSKGLDLSALAAVPNVRHIIAIGESAPELLAVAGERGIAAASMPEAVSAASDLARAGDTVLLAPGCASFDQFESYAARGDAFAAAVSARSN